MDIPSHEVFWILIQWLIWWELQIMSPVDNLVIRVIVLFTTEWRPANETFKHDRAQRPPITRIIVTFSREHLWRNVVRSTNGGVSKLPSILSPS